MYGVKDGQAATAVAAPAPAPQVVLQRCACGGTPGPGGECAACRAKRLQRHAVGTAPAAVPPIVGEVLRSSGRPLDAATRAYMEPRFGHDFSRVRIHVDATADASARAVNADAYTVGERIAFAGGRFEPGSAAGRGLIAHELTHVVQQSGPATRGAAPGVVDPDIGLEAEAEASARRVAAGGPSGVRPAGGGVLQRKPAAHITEVRVDQTAQEVNVTWSDGHTNTGQCSTGKGHCCFDDTPAAAEGGVCSAAGSTQTGNNCTPVGTFTVTAKTPKTSEGIEFWTQFHDAKSVALHDYDPRVDGTPLSHGCVRLHLKFAKLIFEGARVGVTRVIVQNLARPLCNHRALIREWERDFSEAGTKPPDGEQINPETKKRYTRAEIQAERHAIEETRKELRSALGVDEAGLDKQLAAAAAAKDVQAAIPRCVPALTVEEQGLPKAEQAGVAGGAAKAGAALEQALRRARDRRAAEAAVRAAGTSVWLARLETPQGRAGTGNQSPYWMRLALSRVIRQFSPSWARNVDDVRRLQTDLLDLLDRTSSGLAETTAPTTTERSRP
jgi:Domain of unknown function (DUF4157)/L,D-transpeptidase catalytic domain